MVVFSFGVDFFVIVLGAHKIISLRIQNHFMTYALAATYILHQKNTVLVREIVKEVLSIGLPQGVAILDHK